MFDDLMRYVFTMGGHRGSRERNSHPGSGAGARPDDAGRAPGAVPYSGNAYYAALQNTLAQPRPRPSLTVEQRQSEVLAWRAWVIGGIDGTLVLRSLVADAAWIAPLYASGRPITNAERDADPLRYYQMRRYYGDTREPWRGIYATKATYVGDYIASRPVVGLVGLSGRVIEHERGYRAERAMIRRLYLKPDASGHWADGLPDLSPLDALGQLSERYGCDVDFLLPGATPWLEAA